MSLEISRKEKNVKKKCRTTKSTVLFFNLPSCCRDLKVVGFTTNHAIKAYHH